MEQVVGRGARAPEPALSPSATEPKVSAHSGNGQAQFTPGPWSYRSQPHDDWGIVRADRYIICQARNPASDTEYEARARQERFDPYEANARLIAAAPDLYAALSKATGMLRDYIHAVGVDDDDRGLLAECDAALAKARGDA